MAWTAARSLELLPKSRADSDPAFLPWWAALVNGVATAIMLEISPEFERVFRASRGEFVVLPLRGYLGWRRRARRAGYV